MPSIAARVRAATSPASPENARGAITVEPPTGTSATGARFTLTPAPRSCRAAARAAVPHRRRAIALKRLARQRTGAAHGADVAALLVDHHQRAAVARGAGARG